MLKYLLVFIISGLAIANQAENFGLGGSTTGRVSSVLAETENPYAALYNPATLAPTEHSLFAYSTANMGVDFSQGVSEKRSTLWTLGYVHPFQLDTLKRKLGFGISLSGPYGRLRSFEGHAPGDFYSLRYGNSDSQFKGTLAGSIEVIPGELFVGAGLAFFISGAGNAETDLNTKNPTSRVSLDVGLNSSLVAGAFYRRERTSLGISYHQEVNPQIVQQFDGKISFGGENSFHQPLTVRSSLYYEPHSIAMDSQYDLGPLLISAGLSYQLWQHYTPPVIITEAKDAEGNSHSTQITPLQMRNTFNPRASVSIPFFEKKLKVSAGYQYRPSPVTDLSGTENALDSDTHITGASLEYRLGSFTVGAFAQYHVLSARTVSKAINDETGKSSYSFDGRAYLYGVSLWAEL